MPQTAENIEEIKNYVPIPTIRRFHQCPAQIRCIVGPVGSAKTTGAVMEISYYLPMFLYKTYGVTSTSWVIVRNTYSELLDTTMKTVKDPDKGWFTQGDYKSQAHNYYIQYKNGVKVELQFRSCDRPQDLKKFKSFEITGYLIDESIEVPEDIKRMLKTRIGRHPPVKTWLKLIKKKYPKFASWSDDKLHEYMDEHPEKFLTRFGIEVTNPPDVEHPTYSQFTWDTPPPGPIPTGEPLPNHVGFWQPPRENEMNLRPHYYEDLINDYKDNPDWAEMYVEGKPGVTVKGKLVYANFERVHHVAQGPLVWSKGPLFRGWDNSGNCPACIIAQIPTAGQVQVLKEFHTDKLNIVSFTQNVVMECNNLFPGAQYTDWADPAGSNEYSTREGDFTSNAKLMRDACQVKVMPSEQSLTARLNSVDEILLRRDGLLIDPSCLRLVNGFLGGYCYQEIGTSGVFQEKPWKNRFSHVHDSLQYLLTKITKSQSGEDLTGWTPER